MAAPNIIKEFLVSLGFSVDEAGRRKFAATIAAQTVALQEFASTLKATAEKVLQFTAQMAEGMEKLYFASQRTGASVENIQALGFAAGQMGSSVEGAQNSLENFARFLRVNPGGTNLVQSLGVQTQSTNGELRDTSDILQDVGKRLSQMPYYRANAYGQMFGIDEKTLMALREGLGEFGDEYRQLLKGIGLDSQAAAKSSHGFMNQLRSLGATFLALGQKAAQPATDELNNFMEKLRKKIRDNLPLISNILTQVSKTIAGVSNIILRLGGRAFEIIGGLINSWNNLDRSNKALTGSIAALLAGWWALNAGILASPLGIILGLGAAILLLYDDYQTWKEGGKSLIDWGKWEPDIQKALDYARKLGGEFKKLAGTMLDIFRPALEAVGKILTGVFKTGLGNMLDLVTLINDLISGKYSDAASKAEAIMKRTADLAKRSLDTAVKAGVEVYHNVQKKQLEGAAEEAKQAGTDKSLPRGIRNNNPGNLNYVGQAGAGKEAGPNGRFAVYDTAMEGLNALANQLRLYAGRGIDTVQGIISKWAPPNENNTKAYIAGVSKQIGADPNQHLDVNNAGILEKLMQAIIKIENGMNPYSHNMLAAAAVGAAPNPYGVEMTLPATPWEGEKPGKGTTITQTITNHIQAATDPKSTAQAIEKAHNSANQFLIRNTRALAY